MENNNNCYKPPKNVVFPNLVEMKNGTNEKNMIDSLLMRLPQPKNKMIDNVATQFHQFSRPCSAVVVRGAYKHYGYGAYILKDLNLTVPEGKIYGLLGPSGCGKTTLLSCVVGRISLDLGLIKIKYPTISQVGYMPQELALHAELTMWETFIYYGYMFNMSREQIKERSAHLRTLLKLPPHDIIINDLSGGQQRRVSLAVALFHDPKLIILDEPTVGLDPVIAHSIWELLVEMTSKENKTVIITTHYIEEARQADTIGLMREGTLLTEASPAELLSTCECTYLEDAFLKICQSHVASKVKTPDKLPVKQPMRRFSYARDLPPPPLLHNKLFTVGRFKAQLYKNVHLLLRNKPFTLFVILLPLLQTITFNISCGHDPRHLSIGIINQESNCSGNRSQMCLFDDEEWSRELAIGQHPLSCDIIWRLEDKSYKLENYEDLATGKEAVRSNKVWALVNFASGYTRSLITRFNDSRATDDTDIDMGTIIAYVDHSNRLILDMIRRDILSSVLKSAESVMNECNMSTKLISSPVQLQEPIYGSREPSFIHYASPAIMALCAFYLPAIFTGAVIMSEKEEGVIERVTLCGMNFLEIAIAHIVVQFVFLLVQTTLVMYAMFGVFGNPYLGDTLPTAFLLLSIGALGMCFGFCIAISCKSMTEAAFLGIGSNFLLKFLCGLIWPTEGIHYLLRNVSIYLPLTMSTESLRSLTGRGLSTSHRSVYMGFISTYVWIVIFCCFSFLMLKLKRDVWTKS